MTRAAVLMVLAAVAAGPRAVRAARTPADLAGRSADKSEHLMWATVQSEPAQPVDVAALLSQAADSTAPVTGPCCSLAIGTHWGNVASQYLEADQHVARVLASAHYDYVLLASDHSMTRNPGTSSPAGIHIIPPSFDGIFAIAGPGIVAGQDLGSVSLLDVAPTLAYLLDLPVADDLPGTVVTAAFTPDHLTAHPIRRFPSWTNP